MLVLTRKWQEGVWIGDVHVQVLRIGPDSVRLGIEAPGDVRILRDELVPPLERRGLAPADAAIAATAATAAAVGIGATMH